MTRNTLEWLERSLTQHAQKFLSHILVVVRIAAFAATLAFLLNQVADIGWDRVRQSCPTNPIFYAVFLFWYLLLPVADTVIHSYLWRKNLWPYFYVFAMKKVYNFAVLGYSGEAYLYAWARTKISLPDGRAFSVVKDNAILSAMASNCLTIVLIAAAFIIAGPQLRLLTLPDVTQPFILALGAGVLIMILATVLRRYIFALTLPETCMVLWLHTSRSILMLLLQAILWWFVAPTVALEVWLLFAALYLGFHRLPFLPNSDLIFMALSVGLAPSLVAPQDEVTAVMIVTGALTQLTHALVFVFGLLAHLGHRRYAFAKSQDFDVGEQVSRS